MNRPATNPVFVALIVAGAFFMQNFDGTVIATALPQMAISFGTSPIHLNIGITAYLLTVAVFVPISGWIADRFGTSDVLRAAIGIFTIGSLLCALSEGLGQFVAARILQGIGGAMILPVGQLVTLRSAPKQDYVRMINFITIPGLSALIVGPPVGGFITTYASWHWIFLINIPIGLIGIWLVTRFVPNYLSDIKRPMDWRGFVVTGTALTMIIYGLELIGNRSNQYAMMALLFIGGLALGWLAVRHANRHAHPLLDLAPLRIPTFALGVGSGALFRINVGAYPFLLPLLFQVGFGMSAFASGMLMLAHAVGDVSMKFWTRQTLRRFGFRTVLVGNGILTSIVLSLYASFAPTTPVWVLAPVLFFGGFLRSLQFTGLNGLAYADVPTGQMSMSMALASLIQQVSISTGVALSAILLQVALILRGAQAGALSAPDFHLAFAVVALMAFISALIFVKLAPSAGSEVSGHGPGGGATAPVELAAGE